MKKLIASCALLFFALPVFAQVELGIHTSPTLNFNRVSDDLSSSDTSDVGDFDTESAGLRFRGGLYADIFFAERYAFNTGLYYNFQRVGIESRVGDENLDEVYEMQSLQIPFSVKLFTNYFIADRARLYFQLGFASDFYVTQEIQEEPKTNNLEYPTDENRFIPVNLTFMPGAGIEFKLAGLALTGGISYQRGLISIVKDEFPLENSGQEGWRDQITVDTDVVSVDLGVKF